MLISGADDNQIIGWNVETQKVLFKTHEPSLSLTSFASHPARPFTLISSHFDASIQQWSLLGLPDVELAQRKLLFDLPSSEIIDPTSSGVQTGRLSGEQSVLLVNKLAHEESKLRKFELIMEFFSGADGSQEFWSLAKMLQGEGPSLGSERLRISHIKDVAFAYQ